VIIERYKKNSEQGQGVIEKIRLRIIFLDLAEKIDYLPISESDTSYFLQNSQRVGHVKISSNYGTMEEECHGI